MSTLYAQIDTATGQMVGKPQPLPARWITPDGVTIGLFDRLPRQVLASLGWVPVEFEALPSPCTHRHSAHPVYDADSATMVYRAEPVDIDLLRQDACRAIDQAAAEAAGQDVTPGMELRYMAKAQEARRIVQLGAKAKPGKWPLLEAEAGALGESLLDRAKVVDQAHAAWERRMARIEAARVSGKAAVQAASTRDAIVEARDEALSALQEVD